MATVQQLKEQYSGRRFADLINHHLSNQTYEQLLSAIQGTLTTIQFHNKDTALEQLLDEVNYNAKYQAFWEGDCADTFGHIITTTESLLNDNNVIYNDDLLIDIFNLVVINLTYSAVRNTSLKKYIESLQTKGQISQPKPINNDVKRSQEITRLIESDKRWKERYEPIKKGVRYFLRELKHKTLVVENGQVFIERPYFKKQQEKFIKQYHAMREIGARLAPSFDINDKSHLIPVDRAIQFMAYFGDDELKEPFNSASIAPLGTPKNNVDGMVQIFQANNRRSEVLNELRDEIGIGFAEMASLFWLNYRLLNTAKYCMDIALKCNSSKETMQEILNRSTWLNSIKEEPPKGKSFWGKIFK